MTKKAILLTLLIGQTFLWTGSAFMSVLYRLYEFYNPTQAVLLTEVLYYIMQAAGIAAFAVFLRWKPTVAGGVLGAMLSVVATGVFAVFALLSGNGSLIMVSGLFMNLGIGVLSGIYLTRLSSSIPQQCRGRVFGYSYAIGSIGTWLLSLSDGGKLLQSSTALYIFIVLIILSVVLVRYLEPLVNEAEDWQADSPRIDEKLIILALCIPFACSVVNGMGNYFSAAEAAEVLDSTFTRAFYAIGLIAAGYINDRDRRWGAICCASALIFPFISLALKGEVGVSIFLSIFSYIFYGFFSVYRVVLFADLAGKRASLLYLAVFGLMAGRIGDACGTWGGVTLAGNQVVLTCLTSVIFILAMLLFFALYHRLYMPNLDETENTETRLGQYEVYYELTTRQCEIFRLVAKGCSNAEIATELFIAESTVKFHVKNILQKTNCSNRTELIADYRSGKWRQAVQ